MRLICVYSNKLTMNLHLEAHIKFQVAPSVEYTALLFVIIFDAEDYIKIDLGVCIDIFKH